MITADQVRQSFPRIEQISSSDLRKLVTNLWEWVSARNPVHSDVEAIPLHPTLPIQQHGNLASHLRAMAGLAPSLAQTYARQWDTQLDLDRFLTAAYIHDSAKVIEFVEGDGQLVATPGFNHALEGGRIAAELGAPPEIVHMIEAHSFAGPLVVPRTREAQLFLFLDVICLPAFPEHGEGASAVERHLRANNWTAPDLPILGPGR